MIRHVVLFKFKPETSAATLRSIEAAFGRLPQETGLIDGFEWGINSSPAGKDKGFTHAFVMGFPDAAARDAYLPHPAHRAFVAGARPHIEDALVIDYEAQM